MAAPPASKVSIYDSVPLPLGKITCIRVCKIRPNTLRDQSDTIVCDLSILHIDSRVIIERSGSSQQASRTQTPEWAEHQCLSYTWGVLSDEDRVIELNGTAFAIRKNLYDFLHRARKREITGYLWIDAICINQSTVKERNNQVSIMEDIYSHAQCIFVWLGECVDTRCSVLADVFYGRKKNQPLTRKNALPRAIYNFLYLPYWSRAWIVQEYYLAHRRVIWYGDFELTQRCLLNVIRYSHNKDVSSPARVLWSIKDTLHPQEKDRDMMPLVTFFELFRSSQHLECAENRDRIFSLLSLLTSAEREELGIQPDYSKSASSLFADVAKGMAKVQRKYASSEPMDYFRCFGLLENMLGPDVQHLSVQLSILELREFDMGIGCVQRIGQVDHQCNKISEPKPLIGIDGCSFCYQKTTVTFAW